MKKLIMFAIPALFLAFTIVKMAYAWGAYAYAGYTNSGSASRTYADAYASNYGLNNGFWEVYARVGTDKDKEGWNYANGGGTITAHKHKKHVNTDAHASSHVDGWRTIQHPDGTREEIEEEANACENHFP